MTIFFYLQLAFRDQKIKDNGNKIETEVFFFKFSFCPIIKNLLTVNILIYISANFFFSKTLFMFCEQIAKLGTQLEAQKLDLIKYLVGKSEMFVMYCQHA